MAPTTHFLISWLVSAELLKARRERVLVTLSGVVPDFDGLGIIVDKMSDSTNYYFQYHHYLGHSILSALIIASLASVLAKCQRLSVWVLSFIAVHIHILCDLVGSKGADGYHWPIYYFFPFDSSYELIWRYQWELNAWQNMFITVIALFLCGVYAKNRGMTFLEIFGKRFEQEAIGLYRKYIHHDH